MSPHLQPTRSLLDVCALRRYRIFEQPPAPETFLLLERPVCACRTNAATCNILNATVMNTMLSHSPETFILLKQPVCACRMNAALCNILRAAATNIMLSHDHEMLLLLEQPVCACRTNAAPVTYCTLRRWAQCCRTTTARPALSNDQPRTTP